MNRCYLGLGSNQKSPMRQLKRAIHLIKALPHTSVTKISSFYWTKAWGLANQQMFCNAVVEIQTRLSPLSLLKFCQKIESRQGRVRKKHWGPRVIDIDILLYASLLIHSKELTVPHPYIKVREFVTIPLKQINPTLTL